MSYQIYKNLAELNELPRAEAIATFLDCCGSNEWATKMADARPYPLIDALFRKADDVWFSLSTVEHLEAFAAHPQIGSSEAATSQAERSADWSKSEQSSITSSDDEVRRELADINRLYHNKFGFIFIVCATSKSAEEMLAIARARLGNSVETELRIAGEEQSKITRIRLTKLLER